MPLASMRVCQLSVLLMLATGLASLGQSMATLEGTWLTADGSSKIRFEPCAGALCGRLIWLRDPNDPATGRPIRDKNNPNPALRTRRLLGIAIFTDILPTEPGKWRAKAYNAEDSNIYDVTLKRIAPNQLGLTGCGLAGLICKTEVWTRTE